MLRLIAHAQNGRKISRALVYLGGIKSNTRNEADRDIDLIFLL